MTSRVLPATDGRRVEAVPDPGQSATPPRSRGGDRTPHHLHTSTDPKERPMTDNTSTLSDAMAIKKFFLDDLSAGEAMKEIKQLSAEDKAQLGEGIRNGSLTY